MTRPLKSLPIQLVIDYLLEAQKMGHTDVCLIGSATLFTADGVVTELVMTTESQI